MTGAAEIRGSSGEAPAPFVPVRAPERSSPPPAAPPASSVDGVRAPLDDTNEPIDQVTTLASAVTTRSQIMLLRQQSIQQELQLKLDRMRADFNGAQEQRSEQLREMNALRDMAVEQGKKDDEILKKFIAMI
ncbi:MAG: hypothetical protein NVS3B17_00230 [Vulcanimicrobiaceae bacterium]